MVSFPCAFKEPKRLDVVDWDGLTNVLPASLAVSMISSNGKKSGFAPALATIGRLPTNPLRGVLAGEIGFHESRTTGPLAESKPRLALVLASKPWDNLKAHLALGAFTRFPLNKMSAAHWALLPFVGGGEPASPLVSSLVSGRHLSDRHVPSPSTSLAAKTSRFLAVARNLKFCGAYLARLGNHDCGRQRIGGAMMGVEDAQRQGRMFE